jgi:hypothetical protein
MTRFGVKLSSGKVVWVTADSAEAREGMLLFLKHSATGPVVVAGFNLKEVHHFANPEALASPES